MKNQISRDSFHPEQRYSGVYQQQGRMILDADWNELTDIQKTRLADALHDAISGTTTPGGAVGGGAPRVGGLKVGPDPSDPTKILIQPGRLYVAGVPARLDADQAFAVNLQPDYPIKADYSGQNLRLYADVWDRNVTALERGDLLDAALHGADTTSRSQTMLQVKWCADSIDPLNEDSNPSVGSAQLTLKLRLIAASGDTCDPCASEVKVDERLGNYLFRVEVHDYNAGVLTLKWSRDNAAEACAANAVPQGFDLGDWVWEYFDSDTERLLGNHLAPNPKKLRGLLRDKCQTPTGADDPKTFVRQWDGALQIDLNSGKLVVGACPNSDRGVALFMDAYTNQAHGRVSLEGGVLKINLELLELELKGPGTRFVPGDYWLAEVREAKNASGDTVLDGSPPRGIRHHYLLLGQIGADKKLVTQEDAFRRRMAFPPLSDIVAADVGFTENCTTGLFMGAKNVQQALDNLCAISADKVGYLLPNCGANEGKSVKDRLRAPLDPHGDGKLTVKIALDTLLCQLNAGTLPYSVPDCTSPHSVRQLLGLAAGDNSVGPVLDKLLCEFKASDLPLDKADSGLCIDLKPDSVVTVQDALNILCGKSGQGCAVPVTSPGELKLLLGQFAASTATDLWLCLKGGDYPLDGIPSIAAKRSLRLSGASGESVAITFAGATLSVDASEVILENLSIQFSLDGGQLAIAADSAQARNCHFSRTSNSTDGPPMIKIAGRNAGVCRLSLRDNVLYARKAVTFGKDNSLGGADLLGNVTLHNSLLALSGAMLRKEPTYQLLADTVAKQFIAMPADVRSKWSAKLAQAEVPAGSAGARASALMSKLADSSALNAERLAPLLGELALYWTVPDCALRLADANVGGVLEGNDFQGWLLLGNGVEGYTSPTNANDMPKTLPQNVVSTGGADLYLASNTFAAIMSNLPRVIRGAKASASKVKHAVPTLPVSGHGTLTLVGNRIDGVANCITASRLVCQGNTWHGAGQQLGYAVVDRVTFTGNLGETGNTVKLFATVAQDHLAQSGNLLVEVDPMR